MHGVRTEVCVLGGGPAGLTVADTLRRHGHSVVVLEAGPAVPPPGGVPIDTTDSVGLPYPIERSRTSGLGGSSLHWDIETPLGAPFVRLRELDETDFEARPGSGTTGWPFSKDVLGSAYEAAWRVFGLERVPDDGRRVPSGGDEIEERVFRFGPAATFSRDVPARLGSAEVRAGWTVTEVVLAAGGEAVGHLRCRTPSGEDVTVAAEAYVLAAGAIESSRLLLASRGTSPEGVGNRHDLVGRYFMEHPHLSVGLLTPTGNHLMEDTSPWQRRLEGGHVVERRYGLGEQVLRSEGLSGAAFRVQPLSVLQPGQPRRRRTLDLDAVRARDDLLDAIKGRRATDVVRHLPAIRVAAPDLARLARHRLRSRVGVRTKPRAFRLTMMAEQLPNRDSRVLLTDTLDVVGVPRAALDWRLSEQDLWSMRRSLELVAGPLGRCLGGSIRPEPEQVVPHNVEWGWHHMGTTRMAADARHGVVDPDSRLHGVRNLWVAGSSVFPHGGYANPTLTMVALAVRLAEHLHGQLAPREVGRVPSTEPRPAQVKVSTGLEETRSGS